MPALVLSGIGFMLSVPFGSNMASLVWGVLFTICGIIFEVRNDYFAN